MLISAEHGGQVIRTQSFYDINYHPNFKRRKNSCENSQSAL